MPLEHERQRAPHRANIHRLPEAVQHQNVLVQMRLHARNNGAQPNTAPRKVSIDALLCRSQAVYFPAIKHPGSTARVRFASKKVIANLQQNCKAIRGCLH